MKRVIFILPLLIMNAYAGNCYRMSRDELHEMESSYWDNSSVLVKFPSGIRCDNAIFLNVRMRSKSGCISEIGNTRDIILDGLHDRVFFDEFGMPIKTIDSISKTASCEELYVDFKSEVK